MFFFPPSEYFSLIFFDQRKCYDLFREKVSAFSDSSPACRGSICLTEWVGTGLSPQEGKSASSRECLILLSGALKSWEAS